MKQVLFYALILFFAVGANAQQKRTTTKKPVKIQAPVEVKYTPPVLIREDAVAAPAMMDEVAVSGSYDGEGYSNYPKNKERRAFGSTGKYFLESIEVGRYRSQYGITDINKKVILPTIFSEIEEVRNSNGDVSVRLGSAYSLYDKDFNIIFPMEYTSISKVDENSDLYFVSAGDDYENKVVDRTGKSLLDDKYVLSKLGSYYSDDENAFKSYLRVKEKNAYRYGLYNLETRKIVQPVIYEELSAYGSNFIIKEEGQYKLLDVNFKPVLKDGYTYISNVASDLFSLSANNKYGISNSLGQIIIPVENKSVQYIYQPVPGFVVNKDGTSANLYDIKGKPMFSNDIQAISTAEGGVFLIKKAGKWGMINILQNELLACKYDTIFLSGSNTALALEKGKSISYSLTSGTETVLPYDEVERYNYDFYKTKKGGKYGFANARFQQILPTEYDEISSAYFGDYVMIVRKGTKVGLVNNSGKFIFPVEYEKFYKLGYGNSFIVKKDGKFGIGNSYGIVEPCVYDFIGTDTEDSYTLLCVKGSTVKKVKTGSSY